MEALLYDVLLISQYVFGLITFVALFFVSAPYGRFVRDGWGPKIKALYGWVIMESPAVLTILIFFLTAAEYTIPGLAMIVVWQSHYLRRTLHYPFQMKGRDKPFPVLLVIFAITFNLMNGYINGYYVFRLADYTIDWLYDWRFIIGVILFYSGYYINTQSDRLLASLKKSPSDDYQVPRGGLFNYVSSPHYLGEIIEWCGWALLTWSWAGFAFAFYTFANLAPRALSHHRWYHEKFPDYPKERKVLIPYLW